MMRTLVFLALGLLAVTVQGSLLHFGLPDTFLPQLVLVLVVYLGFNEISIGGAFLAFLLGLFLDLSSAILLGPWAGSLVTVYGVLAIISSRIFIESPLVAAFISFFVSIAANIIYMLLGYEYRTLAWDAVSRIAGQAVCTALVAPVLLGMISRRFKKRGSPVLNRSYAASVTS